MSPDDDAQIWAAGPAMPDGPGDCIHIWRILLNPPSASLVQLEKLLSQVERRRAERFRFPDHQRRFVAAHGCLREILSRYLNTSPEKIDFETNAFGKPSLAKDFYATGLTFNLSHSNEMGLIAIGSRRAIGIDIEHVRSDLADEQVARRFFSKREVTELLSLPVEQRQVAFFTCWTRKEAYIKGRGEGLSMPLDQFDVSIKPDQPVELLQTRPDPAQALQWKLYALYPGRGYVAALAAEGQPGLLNCWQWVEVSSE
jgi:4'-phosphopantetheinyl transferase